MRVGKLGAVFRILLKVLGLFHSCLLLAGKLGAAGKKSMPKRLQSSRISCFPESCASRFLGLEKLLFGGKMAEEKRAELYTSPGGKFIRADTLPRILAHWRSFRAPQKQSHFIKYDGELYVGEEVDKLQFPRVPT